MLCLLSVYLCQIKDDGVNTQWGKLHAFSNHALGQFALLSSSHLAFDLTREQTIPLLLCQQVEINCLSSRKVDVPQRHSGVEKRVLDGQPFATHFILGL